MESSNLLSQILESTVSNVALRFKKSGEKRSPLSDAIRRSLLTFSNAVEVLQLAVIPD